MAARGKGKGTLGIGPVVARPGSLHAFLQAYQWVLSRQVDALERSGLVPTVEFRPLVGALWRSYIRAWISRDERSVLRLCFAGGGGGWGKKGRKRKRSLMSHVQSSYLPSSSSAGSFSSSSSSVSSSQVTPPPRPPPVTLAASLGFILVAARALRLPLVAVDLVRWAKNGTIPLLCSLMAMPRSLQLAVTDAQLHHSLYYIAKNGFSRGARAFFSYNSTPSADYINAWSQELWASITAAELRSSAPEPALRYLVGPKEASARVESLLPPMNAPLVLARMARAISLPNAVIRKALELHRRLCKHVAREKAVMAQRKSDRNRLEGLTIASESEVGLAICVALAVVERMSPVSSGESVLNWIQWELRADRCNVPGPSHLSLPWWWWCYFTLEGNRYSIDPSATSSSSSSLSSSSSSLSVPSPLSSLNMATLVRGERLESNIAINVEAQDAYAAFLRENGNLSLFPSILGLQRSQSGAVDPRYFPALGESMQNTAMAVNTSSIKDTPLSTPPKDIEPNNMAVAGPARDLCSGMNSFLQARIRALGLDIGSARLNTLCGTLFGGRSATTNVHQKAKRRDQETKKNRKTLRNQYYQLPSLQWEAALSVADAERRIFRIAGEID